MKLLPAIAAFAMLIFISACDGDRSSQAGPAVANTENAPAVRPAAAAAVAAEEAAWRAAREAASTEAYATFLENHPDGLYAREAAARQRILEMIPINLTVDLSAPEGRFMQAGPPTLTSDGSIAPSRSVAAVPDGTTLTLGFSANVDGEDITETLVATFDKMDGDRMIFRNDAGDCVWNNPVTGGLGYCEEARPAPPEPSDSRALMAYQWLALAYSQ